MREKIMRRLRRFPVIPTVMAVNKLTIVYLEKIILKGRVLDILILVTYYPPGIDVKILCINYNIMMDFSVTV
jgi:hypothetical protein